MWTIAPTLRAPMAERALMLSTVIRASVLLDTRAQTAMKVSYILTSCLRPCYTITTMPCDKKFHILLIFADLVNLLLVQLYFYIN